MSKFVKLTSICLLLTINYSVAANTENNVKIISFEKIEGCYSDNGKSLTTSSICLFNDGTFYYPMFFGVHGEYTLDGNHITLETKHNDLFSVYGRHEPNATQTQFQFANFTSNSLVKFGEGGFSDVSDREQCLGKQRLDLYTHNNLVPKFSVAHVTGTNNPYQQREAGSQMLVSFDYNYDAVFNDFLLVYHNLDENQNQMKGTVLTDKADVWLQMGKDVLSVQKMRISDEHVKGMKQLGAEIAESGKGYQLINQNGDFSARDINNYQHKRENNRFYVAKTNKNQNKTLIEGASTSDKDSNLVTDSQKTKENDKDIGVNHYLKLYEKLNPSGQSISEAFIESRVGADCS